jgi:hypothetical protein
MTYSRQGTYYVTDARLAPHHFSPGQRVWFERAGKPLKSGVIERYLFSGLHRGSRILQWLSPADVTTDRPELLLRLDEDQS